VYFFFVLTKIGLHPEGCADPGANKTVRRAASNFCRPPVHVIDGSLAMQGPDRA
jgi:hypothetical protein